MKKIILLIIPAILIISCPENPLEHFPLTTSGAANLPKVSQTTPNNGAQLNDDDPNTTGIQATVTVLFSDFMDEATLTTSNVEILNTSTGSQVTGFEVTYNATARKLYIRSDDWPDDAAYLLTLKTAIKNTYGSPLDGDGDNVDDGAPYDDALTTFYTGSGAGDLVPITPPVITDAVPPQQNNQSHIPTITLDFSTNMDTLTLTTSNINLLNADSNTVTLNQISVTPTQVSFQPAGSLNNFEKYYVVVKCSQIKADYPANTPSYLLILDGNQDGPEATEPDSVWYFLTEDTGGNDEPPHVSNVAQITGGVRITFDQRMVESTITSTRVRAFDETGYIPGRLVVYNDGGNGYVEYYFYRGTSGGIDVFVSKDVESDDNLKLDGNNNGIGGEYDDDHWEYGV
ncbi:MAG TPA: hypothetical protein EYP58_00170 [bacterium (Candidatus Stahlbacteria)]|nr:hypothetical protein [Candidatus Stahlbacteria bacterium]